MEPPILPILLAVASPVVWLVWTAIQRLFLHPLHQIPGPRLAALTSWYECYFELWLPGQYPFKIKSLHEKYGPVIRPVPDEVHVSDPDFLDSIYALRNRNTATQIGLLVNKSRRTHPFYESI